MGKLGAKTRLKILCNWDTNINISILFIKRFFIQEYVDIFEIVYDDSYDYIIMFNSYQDECYINWDKVILFINEPSWGLQSFRESINKAKYLVTHDSKLISNNNINIEHPSIMFHMLNNNINIEDYKNISPVKKHNLSLCISAKNINNNGLYSKRIEMVKSLFDTSIDFHLYGKGWVFNDNRYKGELKENKTKALEEYKYSVCIENIAEKNYITEKFTDCLLLNTIPIYYGAPNIEEVYPNTYIKLDLFGNYITQLQKFNDVPTDLEKSKYKYIEKMNPFNLILNRILTL